MKKNLIENGSAKPVNKFTAIRQFAKNEEGSFTVFVLIVFIAVLAATGIGVDLMNYERDRATLQSTLDRAVLAAADLDQTEPPKAVVEAYLEKAGLGDKLKSVKVVDNFGTRTVSATAETVVSTNFMRLTGYDTLTAPAASVAEESIGAVEISLVLDISGSMSERSADPSYSKIAVLRDAATDFVNLMLNKPGESEISISIIPYATQVNAGKDLLDKFTNVTQEHSYSHCVNFIPEQYSDADLHRADTLERTAHFDPFTYSENGISIPVCPVRAGSAITAVTNNRAKLLKHISQLTPNGNTSIDIGMKWGVALLDPSMRDVVGLLAQQTDPDPEFSSNKIVPANFSQRPTNYDSDVLKIVIVMTDGKNTNQYMLNPSLRQGYSDVWYNPDSGNTTNWRPYSYGSTKTAHGDYSVYHSQGKPNFFWPQRDQWADHPYGTPDPENADNNEPGEAVRLTYPELFNRVSLAWNAQYNYYWQSSAWAEWYSKAFSKVETSAKNQRTKHVCGAAKDKGIVVYGIAFEAPRSGYRLLEDCASSKSHVYNVKGLDLEDAFASIASSIRKLRLTQ